MKKFVFGFLPMLFVLLGAVPARALTLQWDTPGAIVVQTTLGDASTNIEIGSGATELVLTEAQQYYIRPAEGYKLSTCDVVAGGTSKFYISNWGSGQFVSVGKSYSGYTLKFTTEKMEPAGSFTVNVSNGAEKIAGQLINTNSALSNNTPVKFLGGEQTVNLTNFDNVLYIGKADGVTLKSIYSIKLNNEDVDLTSSIAYNPQYKIPVKGGDKIEIEVYDRDNMPVDYTATFTFKNDDDKALTGVYNIYAGAAKFYDQLVADGWTETYEGDTKIRLNFNEDYVFNSIIANGNPLELKEDAFNVVYTITGNTEFVIDATERVYEDITAQVYITNPEGVNFYNTYMDIVDEPTEEKKLTLTEGTAASGVKMGQYAVPDGTKCFTLGNINPKSGTIFFTVKPGYYVKLVACANPKYADDDANNITYLNAWDAETGPFFMDIRKIENTAKAVIACVGADKVVRVQAYNVQGDIAPVEGLPASNMPAGYTEISFDPNYIDHFTARIAGEVKEGEELSAYLDGTACTADDNGVFQDLKLKDGSLLKMFLATETQGPTLNSVNFTAEEGLTATVVYDKVKRYTDQSKPLTSLGATLVEITPNKPCIVKVNGKEITPDANGVYSFTTEKLSTKVELCKMPVLPLEVKSTTPAEGAAVKTFSMATIVFGMPNGENFVSANEEDIKTITLTTPANETIAAIGCEINGEASEAGIPYGIFFPKQTATGNYTLTIPAGLFCEMVWNDETEEFVAKEDGSVNKEIVLHFTVDPEASVFKKCVMTPANGSRIRSISTISVKFPDAVSGIMPNEIEPMPEITLSNGTTTYTGNASFDMNNSWPPYKSFDVTFMDNEENEVTIKEEGEWTLNIGAGLYVSDEETTPAITAKFFVDPTAPISWTADPENGSKQDMPVTTAFSKHTMITLTFDADAVSYTAKDELAGIRVKYRGEEVNRVEDITAEGANGYMLYNNFGEPQVIFAFNNNVFNAPGILTIEADGGAFTVNDEASPEINYSVTFGDVKEYSYVFTPADGSEVESIKEFTLEFPEATTATYDEEKSYIILSSGRWIYPTKPTVTAVEGAEHPTFKLVFDYIGEDITLTAGSYDIRIGEGSFLLDDNQQSPEITAEWTLKRTTPVDLTWKADPVRDLVNEGYGIYPTIIFSESEILSKNYGSEAKIIVKFNDTEIKQGYGSNDQMSFYTSIENMMPNAIMFNISGGILNDPETEGKLTIVIEEGALLVSGELCPRIEHSWNLVKQKEYEVKVTPAEGSTVKELKDFTVEFIGAKTAEMNFATGISVRSKDYKYNGVVENISFDNSGENAKVNISLKEALTVDGDYQLQIYPSAFFLDGCQTSPEVKAGYVIDRTVGVEGIEADANGKYTVANLSGIIVLRNANEAALGKLPAGMYIVNGKKVVLRK